MWRQGRLTRSLLGVGIQTCFLMEATRHKCLHLKVPWLSHQGPTATTTLRRTIHQGLGLCLMITSSTEIHSGTGMAVHINVGMGLTIITMEEGVIRTGQTRTGILTGEILTVETIICLQDLFHSL